MEDRDPKRVAPKPRRGSTVEMIDRIREQTDYRVPRERTLVGYDKDGKPIYEDSTHF